MCASNDTPSVPRFELAVSLGELKTTYPMKQPSTIILVASNDTHPLRRFELAVSLGELKTAYNITTEQPSEARWKQLGDMALHAADLRLAEECLVRLE